MQPPQAAQGDTWMSSFRPKSAIQRIYFSDFLLMLRKCKTFPKFILLGIYFSQLIAVLGSEVAIRSSSVKVFSKTMPRIFSK